METSKQYTGLSALRTAAGLTAEERDSFTRILMESNMVDTFRFFHPSAQGVFSYYSVRFPQCRELNKGLRLDYALASRSLCDPANEGPRILDSYVLDKYMITDHTAIGCDVGFLEAGEDGPAVKVPLPAVTQEKPMTPPVEES